jgi:SAM-dependent methyltransferase
MVGGFQAAVGALRAVPKLNRAFRSGEGIGWHEHDVGLFHGTERFYRTAYLHHLATEWIPALDGVEAKLHAGGRVADVACGHGASTIVMAKAFPQAELVGFDYHDASIAAARERAKASGLADRVRVNEISCKGRPADVPGPRFRAGTCGLHAPRSRPREDDLRFLRSASGGRFKLRLFLLTSGGISTGSIEGTVRLFGNFNKKELWFQTTPAR